ncbi:aryl-alcohol dehydrogenase-like predicted oxidoreductase [Actinoplanes lutulentus]|uniref:Aryl-alcohol dehydrogenase-like predicted oxidoreductase n=1 Tax=Actinoplanes lutulentus TaxID=1287878 RepID=A0A327ZKI6_9ACTN|nr:aldo/keto reductase [Actinoplanes lutulentus]MBB2940840.1 aryl-alcohol dehydrogenase-like predicted oxidoreductase [Actinoplanes lutulentus]RAK43149.1 aryl-alcohol dehydrogenase-like predicted oxidoreductase [Actinoplanes lutulentus]
MNQYYLLGRSGLRVSRLALGTMNFGVDGFHAAYGKSEEEAEPIFRTYVENGGNFVDTADFYTAGESERILGRLIARSGLRDRLVLTSKFTNTVDPADPNAGGNGRKHMIRALDDSLRRLGTDYLDLFLLHTWDRITPVEEVVRTFDDLVRAGKIRYAGLSDVPAWYASRAQTYAEAHGLSPMVTVQLPYSLVNRVIEPEFVPMAQSLGMGLTAWSPIGGGLLSGKYQAKAGNQATAGNHANGGNPASGGTGRLSGADGSGPAISEHDRAVIGALEKVAADLGRPMAQVAINWVVNQPGVASAVIGASSAEQLRGNMAALDFELPADALRALDEASARPLAPPYSMFTPEYQAWIVSPGLAIGDKPAGYAPPVLNRARG